MREPLAQIGWNLASTGEKRNRNLRGTGEEAGLRAGREGDPVRGERGGGGPARAPGGASRKLLAGHLALVALNLLLFARTGGYGFVYDDRGYVVENPLVQAGVTRDGFRRAFATPPGVPWHPVTWISHMLDRELFGSGAGPAHRVNLALHAANAGMLFHGLARASGAAGPSLFTAAVFAIHPLHVEPVAWVSGRKDLLAAFFTLLALLALGRHAREGRARHEAAALGLFILGLMAKPVSVALPLLLPAAERDPRRRSPWWRALPYLVPALAVSWITVAKVHPGDEPGALSAGDWLAQLGRSAALLARYVAQAAWPRELSVIHPAPGPPGAGALLAALAALAAITAGAVAIRRREPMVLAGWSWFLLLLAPVLGLVPGGPAAFADRYAYLPLAGFAAAAAWGSAGALRRARAPRGVAVALALLALGAAFHSGSRALRAWAGEEPLYRNALAAHPGNHVALHNLAWALAAQGRTEEAAAYYREALRADPGAARTRAALAELLLRLGREEEVAALRRATGTVP